MKLDCNISRNKHYDYVHSATRTVIECVFALLKGRLRRLHFIKCKNVKTVKRYCNYMLCFT
jgi:hypothetical protein